MRKTMKKFAPIYVALLFFACSKNVKKDDHDHLVKIATVKLVNASGQPMYDYLSDSLTDATKESMNKKFVYSAIPAAKTADLYADVKKSPTKPSKSDLRNEALAIDADLVIYGSFTVSKAAKGDEVEFGVTIFRTDKAQFIETINKKTAITAELFTIIEKLSGEIVQRIEAYNNAQLKESGVAQKNQKDQKIELTREGMNIEPFIPPSF